MTGAEFARWRSEQEAIARSRQLLIALFVCSLIGVTAPISGPLAGIYAWLRRARLASTGGTYLAMGYGSAVIGVMYILLIGLSALGH
jgi:hypothetical protein